MTFGSQATSSTLKPGRVLKVASSSLGVSGSASAEEPNHRDTEKTRKRMRLVFSVLSVSLWFNSVFISLPQLVHLAYDQVFDGRGPLGRMAVVNLRGIALVAAFLEDARTWNVGHDVVGVAGDPDLSHAGEFFLEPAVIVDDHFAAERNPDKLVAESPDLHRIMRILVRDLASVELLEHPLGAGLDRVRLAQRVRIPFVLARNGVERQLNLRISHHSLFGQRLCLGDRFLDGDGEFLTVLFAQFDLASRKRVGIRAAADPEEGQRARVLLLDLDLGEPRVIAAPLVELHRRVVTRIAEHDGFQIPLRVFDLEHWDGVIDRSFRVAVVDDPLLGHLPAVDREAGGSFAD